MKEFDLLINVLRGCADKTAMYGYPEHAETLCKHLTHICLSILQFGWRFELTEQLWHEVAQSLDFGQQFAFEEYETTTYRQQKWGAQESTAHHHILTIFVNIWNKLKDSCNLLYHTSNWLEFLLANSLLLGSPDNLDMTLRGLIGIAATNCDNQFETLYHEECFKAKGSASRGLLDFGTKDDWVVRLPKYSDQISSYTRVSQGVTEIIKRLEQMKQNSSITR